MLLVILYVSSTIERLIITKTSSTCLPQNFCLILGNVMFSWACTIASARNLYIESPSVFFKFVHAATVKLQANI